MSSKYPLLMGAAASLLVAGNAYANTIVDTGVSTLKYGGGTIVAQPNGFDSSLGSLTGVAIAFGAGVSDNVIGNVQTYTTQVPIQATVITSLIIESGYSPWVFNDYTSSSQTVTPTYSYANLYYTADYAVSSHVAFGATVAMTDLPLWVAPVAAPLRSLFIAVIANVNLPYYGDTTNLSVFTVDDYTITYTYSPRSAVAEPASSALLGVGLLGLLALAAARRHR